jgi:FtsP/CotA-like multicopper oxidase with cupredoxin domain
MQKRLGTVQNFTLTASSQASADFGAQTYRVRVALASGSTIAVNGGAYILFGDTTGLTVSSTNGSLVPAPWAEDFTVTPGQTFYCIEATTSHGTISLTEYA